MTAALEAHMAHRRADARRDPTRGMFRTHTLTGDFGPSNVPFPVVRDPVTFRARVQRGASLPVGIILEIGGATTGACIWIPSGGTGISACAGNAGVNGATVSAPNVIHAANQILDVVVAINSQAGKVGIWINGTHIATATSDTVPMPSGWVGSNAGGVAIATGSVTSRVTGEEAVNLANASVLGPVSAYYRQLPRGFR